MSNEERERIRADAAEALEYLDDPFQLRLLLHDILYVVNDPSLTDWDDETP